MDVDEACFWPQLLPVLRSICDATFVAIDVEMSGIPMKGYGLNDRSHLTGKPNLQELYEESREAALKYQVLQFGITCIEEDRDRDMYVARPYNFNVSPLLIHGDKLDIKRDITFQSSAIHFLIKNSFDIGAVFTKGVPYLSREEESSARLNYTKKQELSSSIPDIVISPNDDEAVAFYTKARKTIFDFANQKKQEMDYVNIGNLNGLNGLQRRLVHQLIRNEFPSCRTFARSGGEFMQVEKLDPVKEAQIAKSRLQTFESSLARQTGLRFLFEALVGGDLSGLDPKWFAVNENNQPVFTDLEATKKTIQSLQKVLKNKSQILVGHNLFNDLIFIYQTFVGTLPNQVTEFSQLIHELFPRVFDTKYLATQAGSSMRTKSGLKDLVDELGNRLNPFIVLAERHIAYGPRSKEHEAGYDSWMTAQVFLKLSSKLATEQGVVESPEQALDSERGTSSNLLHPEGTNLNHPDKPYISSRSARRALSTQKKLRNGSREKSKKSNGSIIFSTTERPKFKERVDTLFSDTNMFDNLHVEGVNDGDSTRSSSPDTDNGGVPLEVHGLARELTLMDSEIDADFRVVSGEQEVLQPQSAKYASGTNGLSPKDVPGGLSRYWYAAQLNKCLLQDSTRDEPKEDPWIPNANSSFWKIYVNRLRVYGTETEVCYLGE